MGRFFQLSPDSEKWHGVDEEFSLTDPDPLGHQMARSFSPDVDSGFVRMADVCSKVSLRFAPIDHNAKYEIFGGKDKHCDGFLYSASHATLVFVELKNRDAVSHENVKKWTRKAITQLRRSICNFRKEEPCYAKMLGGVHWAFVANAKSVYGAETSTASQRSAFLSATRNFELHISNRIEVPDESFVNVAGD